MVKRRTLRMVVEVDCPTWLNPAQARREVRSLINQQAFYGHDNRKSGWSMSDDDVIGDHNFRARSVRAVPKRT